MSDRRYNQWAGNPNGHKKDLSMCHESVSESGRGMSSYQCAKKWKYDEDGEKWCGTHRPSAVKARAKKSQERWDAKMARHDAPAKEIKSLKSELSLANKKISKLEGVLAQLLRFKHHSIGEESWRIDEALSKLNDRKG